LGKKKVWNRGLIGSYSLTRLPGTGTESEFQELESKLNYQFFKNRMRSDPNIVFLRKPELFQCSLKNQNRRFLIIIIIIIILINQEPPNTGNLNPPSTRAICTTSLNE